MFLTHNAFLLSKSLYLCMVICGQRRTPPPQSRIYCPTEAWIEKVKADLKGADFEKKLVWRTNEGFNVQPMYRAENTEGMKSTDSVPGEYPYIRGTKCDNKWFIRQDIAVDDTAAANAKAKEILGKGVSSLGLKLKKEDINADAVAKLLDGIDVENVEINFCCCVKSAKSLIETFAAYLKGKGADLSKVKGSVNFDPFKRMLKKGRDMADVAGMCADIVNAASELPRFRVLSVDASMLCNAGSYITQELGFALAWGNEYMSMLTDKGIDADTAAGIHAGLHREGVGVILIRTLIKVFVIETVVDQTVDRHVGGNRSAGHGAHRSEGNKSFLHGRISENPNDRNRSKL